MKKSILFIATLIIVVGINASFAQEINLPFTESKYKSDENYFREKASGKSPDMSIAKSKAVTSAKKTIAGLIQPLVDNVVDKYTIQLNVDEQSSFGEVFQEQTRVAVSQTLKNINIMDEKAMKDGNLIVYWVVIEVPKDKLVENIEQTVENNLNSSTENGVSSENKDKLELDKEKFEKIFNEEMQKLGE